MRAQTRFHGKPAVSFFNDAHGRRSVAGEKPLIDTIGIIPPNEKIVTKEGQAKTHPEPLTRKGNDISVGASFMSNLSDPDTLGGLSNLDKVNSSREVVSSTGDAQAARCRGLSTTHHSRCNAVGKYKGHQGFSRRDGMGHALNDRDGVCNLEAKLVFLDGVLHDPRRKALVEATLGHNH